MKLLTLWATFSLTAFAGGLYLEVSPSADGKLLQVQVTACHEPAKSMVTAHLVTIVDGEMRRQALAVSPVANQPGSFAIAGQLPAHTVVVELAVTNPEYGTYQPKVLLRAVDGAVQVASKKHFFSVPPKLADYQKSLEATAITD